MLLPDARKRASRVAFLATVSLILVLGIFSSAYVYVQVDRSGRMHILERAGTIAEAIPISELTQLTGTEADVTLPAYESLKDLLVRMRAANHDVRFIYLMGQNSEEELFFFADSENPDSEDYSPPGQVYYEATPAMLAFFENGRAQTEGPDQDRWGIWISGYAPVRDADGTIIAMLGMDLPANQFLADELTYAMLPALVTLVLLTILIAADRNRRRELVHIEQKAEFLSIASHEIRTPLTGIRWAIEGIMSNETKPLDPRTRSVLALVHDSCLSLIGRVNNLLDLSALENQKIVMLKKERIEILAFLRDIIDSLMLSANQRSVAITLDDAIEDTASLVADRQMMHHAFFNLLSNAIKYTKEGTDVVITYAREGNDHVFKVTDHGEGVSVEEQERIFEGYHRSEEAIKSGQYGTGLGLFLVRKAAELHGGSITVASTHDVGSTFILSIPDTK